MLNGKSQMYQQLSCVAIPSSMAGLGSYDCLMIASDPDGYGESSVGNRVIISCLDQWGAGEELE